MLEAFVQNWTKFDCVIRTSADKQMAKKIIWFRIKQRNCKSETVMYVNGEMLVSRNELQSAYLIL